MNMHLMIYPYFDHCKSFRFYRHNGNTLSFSLSLSLSLSHTHTHIYIYIFSITYTHSLSLSYSDSLSLSLPFHGSRNHAHISHIYIYVYIYSISSVYSSAKHTLERCFLSSLSLLLSSSSTSADTHKVLLRYAVLLRRNAMEPYQDATPSFFRRASMATILSEGCVYIRGTTTDTK